MVPTHLRAGLRLFWAALVVAVAVGSCTVPGVPVTVHFPLKGAHDRLACGDCHGASLSATLSTTCIGCHLDDRPAVHDPHDCGGCHQPTTWGDVVVDHDKYLSLGGGHAGVPCTECHLPDTWKGLDPACESCHESDRPSGHYAGACADCHSPSGWDDATFDHRAFFPTPHHGVSSCASCHPAPAGTASFTCIDCHEHSKSRTDGDHRGMSRYRYESAACLDCHPRGDD